MREDHLNHQIIGDGLTQVGAIRHHCIELEKAIDAFVPDSREKSLAKTKLEETRMWAIKGIAMQYPAQPIPGAPEEGQCQDGGTATALPAEPTEYGKTPDHQNPSTPTTDRETEPSTSECEPSSTQETTAADGTCSQSDTPSSSEQ